MSATVSASGQPTCQSAGARSSSRKSAASRAADSTLTSSCRPAPRSTIAEQQHEHDRQDQRELDHGLATSGGASPAAGAAGGGDGHRTSRTSKALPTLGIPSGWYRWQRADRTFVTCPAAPLGCVLATSTRTWVPDHEGTHGPCNHPYSGAVQQRAVSRLRLARCSRCRRHSRRRPGLSRHRCPSARACRRDRPSRSDAACRSASGSSSVRRSRSARPCRWARRSRSAPGWPRAAGSSWGSDSGSCSARVRTLTEGLALGDGTTGTALGIGVTGGLTASSDPNQRAAPTTATDPTDNPAIATSRTSASAWTRTASGRGPVVASRHASRVMASRATTDQPRATRPRRRLVGDARPSPGPRSPPRSASRAPRQGPPARGPAPVRPATSSSNGPGRRRPARADRSAASVRSSGRSRTEVGAEPGQPAMQVGLDGAQRSTGLARDLVERRVGEEAQRDDLAIRLGQRRDRGAQLGGALGADGQARRVGPVARRRGAARSAARETSCPGRSSTWAAARGPATRPCRGDLPGAGRGGRRCGPATPRSARRHARWPASGRRSRRPPGRRPRPPPRRRGPAGRRAPRRAPRDRRCAGRRPGRRPARRRRRPDPGRRPRAAVALRRRGWVRLRSGSSGRHRAGRTGHVP